MLGAPVRQEVTPQDPRDGESAERTAVHYEASDAGEEKR